MVCLFEIFAIITVTNSIHKPKNPQKFQIILYLSEKRKGLNPYSVTNLMSAKHSRYIICKYFKAINTGT